MGLIYVSESGKIICVKNGKLTVGSNEHVEEFPQETVEGICVFGKSQMTSDCIKYCLKNNVSVSFFDENGKYYGGLFSSENFYRRVQNQVVCSFDEAFCLEFARRIIKAKVSNQIVLLRRILRDTEKSTEYHRKLVPMYFSLKKINLADSISQLMGYEGFASKTYFKLISDTIPKEYCFCRRTRRPAKDPVNAMLNFGYSMLTKEISGELINRGLIPNIGFMHESHEQMPSLACDMIEEWRSIIVDAAVINLFTSGNITSEMYSIENGSCKLKSEAVRLLIVAIEKKMHITTKYISTIDKQIDYRQSIWHQAEKLGLAVDSMDYSIYVPIQIR